MIPLLLIKIGSDAVVMPDSLPGLMYSITLGRMHFYALGERAHYSVALGRIHYDA